MSAPRRFSPRFGLLAIALTCAGIVAASPSASSAQTHPSGLRVDGLFGAGVDPDGWHVASLSKAEQERPQGKDTEKGAAKPAKKPSKPPVFRFTGFFETGYQGFVAKDTFDAVLGKSGGSVIGGGVSLTHESGIFVQMGATRFKAEGERVFVYGTEVFPLGIPLSVKVTPIEVSGGYKFFVRQPKPKAPPAPNRPTKPSFQPARPLPGEGIATTGERPAADNPAGDLATPPRPAKKPRWGGLQPYVGGGFGVVKYEETSDFAASGDDVKDSYTSLHALGGIDIPIWKWIGAGAEFRYRWVKDALGAEGVSMAFGEDDLGGPSFLVKITIGG